VTVFDPPGPAVVVRAAGALVVGLTAALDVPAAELVRVVVFGPVVVLEPGLAVFVLPLGPAAPPVDGG